MTQQSRMNHCNSCPNGNKKCPNEISGQGENELQLYRMECCSDLSALPTDAHQFQIIPFAINTFCRF